MTGREIAIHARKSPSVTRPRHSLALTIGVLLVLSLAAMAILSLAWTPFPLDAMDVLSKLQTPSLAHVFGTDHFGRDTFSLVMGGAWTSLSVGLGAVAVGLLGGIPIGLIAAWHRDGIVAAAIDRSTDLVFAFPALLTAVLVASVHGPGAANVIAAIGLFNIAVFARVTRGAAFSIASRPFVTAAIAIGRSQTAILALHILPNITGVLIVQATVQFAIAILAEAGLGYLGLGVQPPNPSWGRMLADAQTFMFMSPWQAIFPGLAIMLAVLGLNLLGDGLRDHLDPRVAKRGISVS